MPEAFKLVDSEKRHLTFEHNSQTNLCLISVLFLNPCPLIYGQKKCFCIKINIHSLTLAEMGKTVMNGKYLSFFTALIV